MSRVPRRFTDVVWHVTAAAAVVFSFVGGFSLFFDVFYQTSGSRSAASAVLAAGALLWLVLYLCSWHAKHSLRSPALWLAASFLLFVGVGILLAVCKHPEAASWRELVFLVCSGIGLALVWRTVLRDARRELGMPPKI